MSLTGKQRKQLKSMGQTLDIGLTLGKAGIKESVLAEMNLLLREHELVKVRLPAGDPKERKALAEKLAHDSHGHFVGGTGRTFLIYRENPRRDPSSRIELTED